MARTNKSSKKMSLSEDPDSFDRVQSDEEFEENFDEEPKITEKAFHPTPKQRIFNKDDLIPCMSITPGEMFFEGDKTRNLYTWATIGYVAEIEYQDLNYAIQQNHPMITKPRFIIQDKDVIAQYPHLDKIYSGLYSVADLKSIIKKTPQEIESEVAKLPLGAKEALKGMVSTMIGNGSLDSINRIKALDKSLGTEMLLKLSGNT